MRAYTPAERASRRRTETWIRARGGKPTRTQHVYRVETDEIEVPEWAKAWALEGFSSGPSLIWVKERIQVKRIIALDPGNPLAERFEARKCKRCGRWLLGLDAQQYTKQVELARIAAQPAPECGISCTSR